MPTTDPNHLLLRAIQHLDHADREAFLRQLAEHAPEMLHALSESESAVAALALSLPPVAPPEALRGRLMDRVVAGPRPQAVAEAVRKLPAPAWKANTLRYAAVLLIGVTLGIVAWQLAVARPAKRELAEREKLIGSPETSLILFKGQPVQPQARGRVFVDRAKREAQIHLFYLKPPAPNRVYELWLFPDQPGKAAPLPSQTFTVDASGRATLTVPLPPELSTLAAAAVSDEPPGGSQSPTGQIHLLGTAEP